MGKANVYFVMYLVLLTELLVIVTERDNLTKQEIKVRNKMLSSIGKSYENKVLVTASPQDQSWESVDQQTNKPNGPAEVSLDNIGLVSDQEKAGVKYMVKVAPGSKAPSGWPGNVTQDTKGQYELKFDKKTGKGQFFAKFNDSDLGSLYTFELTCEVERVLPDYLPKKLQEELEHKLKGKTHQKAAPFKFQISPQKIGKGEIKKGPTIEF